MQRDQRGNGNQRITENILFRIYRPNFALSEYATRVQLPLHESFYSEYIHMPKNACFMLDDYIIYIVVAWPLTICSVKYKISDSFIQLKILF